MDILVPIQEIFSHKVGHVPPLFPLTGSLQHHDGVINESLPHSRGKDVFIRSLEEGLLVLWTIVIHVYMLRPEASPASREGDGPTVMGTVSGSGDRGGRGEWGGGREGFIVKGAMSRCAIFGGFSIDHGVRPHQVRWPTRWRHLQQDGNVGGELHGERLMEVLGLG